LFTVAILPHDAVNGHTASHQVIAAVPVFDKIPGHGYNQFYFISLGCDHSAERRDALDLHIPGGAA
jgi:hypothetical protein